MWLKQTIKMKYHSCVQKMSECNALPVCRLTVMWSVDRSTLRRRSARWLRSTRRRRRSSWWRLCSGTSRRCRWPEPCSSSCPAGTSSTPCRDTWRPTPTLVHQHTHHTTSHHRHHTNRTLRERSPDLTDKNKTLLSSQILGELTL